MFKVDFFVDDKKLGTALNALMGIAYGQPSVQPVINAKKNGNGLAAESGGSRKEMFAAALAKKKGEHINAKSAREILRELGITPSSVSYYLKTAVERKVLRKSGKGTSSGYTVL